MVVAGYRFHYLKLSGGYHPPDIHQTAAGGVSIGWVDMLVGDLFDGDDIGSERNAGGGTSRRKPAASVVFENDRARANGQPPS
jgi:hypothetical protein